MTRLLIACFLFVGVLAYSRTISCDGDSAAVQNAINSAASGDTVKIAAGHFSWSTGVQIKKFLHLAGDSNLGTVIEAAGGNESSSLVAIEPSASGKSEVSYLHFVRGSGAGHYLSCTDQNGQPALIHDINFETTGFGHGCVTWMHNGGVIYDCTFSSTDKADNSGIQFKNPQNESAWHEASTMGDKDRNGDQNTYVEDCTFNDQFAQCMDVDDNSRTVIRHCTFNNSSIGSHGQETSPIGVRQWEVYENEFIFTLGGNCNPNPYPLNINQWFFIRGGAGVCWGNFMPPISSCSWGNKASVSITLYNIRRRSGYVPCQTSYPAARQMGWGSDASGKFISDPMYFWENLGGTGETEPVMGDADDECGNNQHTRDYVVKGRDYFVGSPKPGYTPYAYPHPLRTGGGGPGPTPTPSATPTPNPTATPAPSATPVVIQVPYPSTITIAPKQ